MVKLLPVIILLLLKNRHDENLPTKIFESISCSNKNLICSLIDAAIEIGTDSDNWLFDENEDAWTLVKKCKEKTEKIGSLTTNDSEVKDEVYTHHARIISPFLRLISK